MIRAITADVYCIGTACSYCRPTACLPCSITLRLLLLVPTCHIPIFIYLPVPSRFLSPSFHFVLLIPNRTPQFTLLKMETKKEEPHVCGHCKTVETWSHPLKRCAGCHAAWYCHRDCQKAAWKLHKKQCDTYDEAKSDDNTKVCQELLVTYNN